MILSLCLPAMSVSGQSPEITSAENLQDRISRTIAKVEPAVVFVATFQSTPGQAFRKDEDPFDALMENRGLMATTSGCGVVIGMEETQQSRAWLVLTGIEAIRAAAVSEEAENVVVAIHTNAGVTHRAMVLAADPMIGLAVLRVPADLPVPPIVWNPKLAALDVPQKGWLTLLIDSPSPMRKNSGSVDLGLISNIIRLPVDPPRPTQSPPVPHPYLPGKYLAIGANGIPAHGGVPVLSLDGNLLGLIDALAASSREAPGKALAIPCTGRYARLIAALQDGLEVEYGWLGVSARSADALPKEARPGVEVTQVWRGGPADRAGIQTGDILLNVGEVSVEDELDLNREIALFEPGAVVDISRYRPSALEQSSLPVTLGKWPVEEDRLRIVNAHRAPVWRGLRVDWPTARRRFLPRDSQAVIPRAVVVVEVLPGSPAAAAGLKVGQFIEKVGERPVSSPAEFLSAVETWPDTVPVTVAHEAELLIRKPEGETP